MSTACLIAKQHGPDGMQAVYCHWDGSPTTMVPVLRRLVLDTFNGSTIDALDYLFASAGSGYWSRLSGSGQLHREDTSDRATANTIDVYHDYPDSIDTLLTLRGGSYGDSPLIHWPQQWVYILYREVLAIVRYVAPSQVLGTTEPTGVACQALAWADPVDSALLVRIETEADQKVSQMFARAHERQPIAA